MIKVDVGQYRVCNKGGALKGSFSILIYPNKQKILDCRHFEKDGRQWFAFPHKVVKKDEEKLDYIPLISYGDKEYLAKLQEAVIEALKTIAPTGKRYDNQGTAHSLPFETPTNHGALPF